jgi:hypothetical protein
MAMSRRCMRDAALHGRLLRMGMRAEEVHGGARCMAALVGLFEDPKRIGRWWARVVRAWARGRGHACQAGRQAGRRRGPPAPRGREGDASAPPHGCAYRLCAQALGCSLLSMG